MTTFAGQSRRTERQITRQRILLSWSISRQAAASAGLGDGEARLEIEIPWPAHPGPVVARLIAQNRVRELAAAQAARWLPDQAACLAHLDAGHILVASLRTDADGMTALYARTGLLEALGIGGGRYDFDGASSLH